MQSFSRDIRNNCLIQDLITQKQQEITVLFYSHDSLEIFCYFGISSKIYSLFKVLVGLIFFLFFN